MISIPVHFSPDLLNSYAKLREFLVGKEKDKHVEAQVLKAGTQSPAKPSLCPTVLQKIYGVFAKSIGNLLYYLGLSSWGLYVYLHGELALRDRRDYGFAMFGENYLAHSANLYSPECAPLYALPRMSVKDLESSEVRAIVHSKRKELTFDQHRGLCRGKSLWLLRAYLKTGRLFADHRRHIQALGHLFSRGAPPEAALIQKLCPSAKFLGIEEISTTEAPLPRTTDKVLNDKKARKLFIQTIKNLSPGAYYFRVPKHGMAYVCEEKGRGYWFDPNSGMKAIHTDAGFQKLAQKVVYYYKTRVPKLGIERAKKWEQCLCKFIKVDLAK